MGHERSAFGFEGKVALATVAARGIGHACALALARAGADVVLGLRRKESGRELAEQIGRMGRRALCGQMDMTRVQEIREGVREAEEHFSRIDILVNNAGVGAPNPAERVTEKDFDQTIAVNLKGTFSRPRRSAWG